ncbi:MAG: type I-U CRISPR-associated helicase/endonuclease Cas3, partial [Planctomycetales bacterium]|nr:type I-U CRISPR-associated helicase/endonuclease Cas3 [Planctomycetales bacterium]
MNPITIDDFAAFFQELHARDCYSWQRRLADRAVSGNWPGAIDLPTGSGKTACIDVAIFALACQASRPIEQRNAPRRIFFCVNRRVIVDEAFQRARKIAMEILRAEQSSPEDKPTLFRVSQALRAISGIGADDAPPLDVIELRGGIYRDNRWARSVTQPSVICSTIDQIGSRLLFRGYGVSQYAAPIQAALVAYNSLLLLDEAHISEPFRQTANAVRNYLDVEKWADESVGAKPIVFVPMTATPKEVDPDNVIKLDAADRKNESLDQRLTATKCAELCDIPDVAKEAVTRAKSLLKEAPMAVGIIVNRVATAKEIYEKLRSHDDSVHVELVIGSMRPVDRDKQQNRLRELVGPGRPDETQRSSLTIATQCLEVGADYDFDSLITECASLDALRQRFGRLNRSGRPIDAKAVILAAKRAIKPEDKLDDAKPLDPIYDNALARTWNWLKEQEEQSDDKRINFGIDAFDALLKDSEEGRIPENLLAPSALVNAPTMLPAYLDLWCQTSPRPQVEPDVSLFLHGKEAGAPDVQVCWRADLLEKENKQWCDIVSLVPPTSAECMNVPLVRVQQWLTGHPGIGGLACDVPDVEVSDEQHERKPVDPAELKRQAVLWRSGNKSSVIKSVANVQAIRPGDTIVLPTFTKGWDQLGHIPEIDVTNNNDVDEADDRGL